VIKRAGERRITRIQEYRNGFATLVKSRRDLQSEDGCHPAAAGPEGMQAGSIHLSK
jgi:hypothetical protein